MKKLITIIIVASLALTIRAQDITNTLGSSGNFKVYKNDGTTNLFTLSEDESHTMRFSAGQKGFTIFNEHGNSIFQLDDPYSLDDLGVLKLGKVDDFWLNESTDFPNLLIQNSVKHPNISMVSIGAPGSRINSYAANTTEGGSPTAIGDGHGLLGLYGYGHNGTTYKYGASMVFLVDGTPSSNVPAKIEFYTGTDSDIPLRRMTIKSDGKVGIGTDTPNSTLNVGGSVSVPVDVFVENHLVTETEYTIITEGDYTVTLPDPTGIAGRVYVIKRIGDNTTTHVVSAGTSIKIDGQATVDLIGAWKYIMVQSTGGSWVIISQNL